VSLGSSDAFLRNAALLCLLLWAAACGRLGYGFVDADKHADAGTRSSANTAERPLRLNEVTGMRIDGDARRDAGADPGRTVQPPTAAATQPRDAAVSEPSGPQLASGQTCVDDRACASGACVAGVCCESHCTEPGPCQGSQGVSCGGGHCSYTTLEDGASCDDANTCSSEDRCYRGYCFGVPRNCDDGEECTSDFCTAGSCTHASSCNPKAEPCSYGLLADHGYWMCPVAVSFDSAQDECARIGAHLVTINDADEQSYLWGRGMSDTWIGYRAAPTSAGSGFEWVSGSSQYDDWANGEPDAGMDRCAYLSAAHGGAWDSHDCDSASSGFACEIEQYPPPDAGCTYLRGYGQGYFICSGPRLWSDAKRHCEKVGAQLAEIGNEVEQGFLATFLLSGTRYAIGLHDRVQSGQFAWESGTPLMYTAWDEMQPAPVSRGSSYVAMDGYSGAWSTFSASDAVGFVCEQKR
jgi:hypothetical protein